MLKILSTSILAIKMHQNPPKSINIHQHPSTSIESHQISSKSIKIHENIFKSIKIIRESKSDRSQSWAPAISRSNSLDMFDLIISFVINNKSKCQSKNKRPRYFRDRLGTLAKIAIVLALGFLCLWHWQSKSDPSKSSAPAQEQFIRDRLGNVAKTTIALALYHQNHRNPSKSIKINQNPSKSTKINRKPSNSMQIYQNPSKFIKI